MFDKNDTYDCISPVDYRYWDKEVAECLSENARIQFQLLAETALVKVLYQREICSKEVFDEIASACQKVTAAEVYEEEKRIGHDIRALVNCIRNKVGDEAKPFVHMTATSYDIIDTANIARYKKAVCNILVPSLHKLKEVLLGISLREAKTLQVGRTHGQHAVPITFGFAIAGYVSRLGNSIEALKTLSAKLVGKFSGAVGAYNALSLFFEDPDDFEAEVLFEMGLMPAEHSTQIVPPEALMRLLCEITIVSGILADLADDMRHLQRTEIGEVGEEFRAEQVGSSTMPQKRNPINFENVKSIWKIVVSRITMVFMDQLSEHQRDLTNSASARTYGEIIAYVISASKRMTSTMWKLSVDHSNLKRNFDFQKGLIAAEPLYIMLASLGHPHAHEKVKELTLLAQKEQRPLSELFESDEELKMYRGKMTLAQQQVLSSPSLYAGIAAERTVKIIEHWRK